MEDWTVILRRPDGRLEFEHVEAESFALERDPLSKNSPIRYYVLRDSDRAEVALFNEKDVVGIRKGATGMCATLRVKCQGFGAPRQA